MKRHALSAMDASLKTRARRRCGPPSTLLPLRFFACFFAFIRTIKPLALLTGAILASRIDYEQLAQTVMYFLLYLTILFMQKNSYTLYKVRSVYLELLPKPVSVLKICLAPLAGLGVAHHSGAGRHCQRERGEPCVRHRGKWGGRHFHLAHVHPGRLARSGLRRYDLRSAGGISLLWWVPPWFPSPVVACVAALGRALHGAALHAQARWGARRTAEFGTDRRHP